VTLAAPATPLNVSYCHCIDCRRHTGGPVAAFAGFDEGTVRFTPSAGPGVSVTPGVRRWFCAACGSPLGASFDYFPGQIFVPLGVIDQAAGLVPSVHAYAESALPWLHIEDAALRIPRSSREHLNADPCL
jgi:hypothetical protein